MENSEFAKLKKPIALVVDDEPLILMDTSGIITDEGYAVIEVTTADQAFEVLAQHSSLELLFTDVQTPGCLNGFGLARKVEGRWPPLCVFIASGAATPRPAGCPTTPRF
ncbi:response regulator, partial [Neorhizobium galegae]|uniref:response regulator n=1 Tax=Neorhizobium galegae TaxID=399 RepID=UPI0021081838